MFHDLFRGMETKALDAWVRQLDLPEKYLGNPNLSHSKIAAAVMQRDYGITDSEVLDAVRYHTTGRAGMGTLEKIIFLADSIEPGREYPGVSEIRRMSEENLDLACLMCLERTIEYINCNKGTLDADTLEARDWLKNKEKIHGEQKPGIAGRKGHGKQKS